MEYRKIGDINRERIEEGLDWIRSHWDSVAGAARDIRPSHIGDNDEDVHSGSEEHSSVILLLDRQKPSVVCSYSFDEERFGINKAGQIIWGFDSGCSCPTPWDDSYPQCYETPVRTWKEFTLNGLPNFDEKFEEEVLTNMRNIGVPV